jgi:cytochrome c-type biogenesis protein CcmH
MTPNRRRRRAALLALLVAVAPVLTAPTAQAAAPPRASLTDIENDVMCVVCNEPLAVSRSPEADQERTVIRSLIARGETKSQIERQLVAQYGPGVLGKPPAHGFNLTVYVLPPAVVAVGLGVLAVALPRWRRRAAAARSRPALAGPALEPAEERRLDEELGRYRG